MQTCLVSKDALAPRSMNGGGTAREGACAVRIHPLKIVRERDWCLMLGPDDHMIDSSNLPFQRSNPAHTMVNMRWIIGDLAHAAPTE